jgi:hypothetical protein
MTDKTPKTLPQDVIDRAMQAIATLHAWNGAVWQARSLEALTGRAGRYEYDLLAYAPLWNQKNLGEHTLDTLVQEFRAHGWSPDDFFSALGYPRPQVEKQGPHVMDWREGDR